MSVLVSVFQVISIWASRFFSLHWVDVDSARAKYTNSMGWVWHWGMAAIKEATIPSVTQ